MTDQDHKKDKRTPFFKPSPGSRPGLVYESPAASDCIAIVHYFQNGKWTRKRYQDAADLEVNDDSLSFVWVEIRGLDIPLIKSLSKIYDIHPLIFEDIVNNHQRPKFDRLDGYEYLVLKVFSLNNSVYGEQVSVFRSDSVMVTVQESNREIFKNLEERFRLDKKGNVLPAEFLTYLALDHVIDLLFPFLENISEAFQKMEDDVIHRPKKSHLLQLQENKRMMVKALGSTWAHYEVVSSYLKNLDIQNKKKLTPYLKDCQDHTLQVFYYLKDLKEDCIDLTQVYLGIQSNHTNEIMKFLTIIASIFLPLSFIAGLYGMNFDRDVSRLNMPELGWEYGYVFALGLMLFSVVVLMAALGYKIRQYKDV